MSRTTLSAGPTNRSSVEIRQGRKPAGPILVGLALAALGTVAGPASAYSKFEHEQLTFYAFELARQRVCAVESPPEACAGFEVTSSVDGSALTSSVKLGAVTRAVDYFSNPRRLAPVAAACMETPVESEDDEGCRDTAVKACRDLEAPECLAFALEHSIEKVGKRRFNRFYRALAVHRNDEHFRQGARDEYNVLHRRALEFAHGGSFAQALVAEAIALHFLQDAFSPGHLAAPREQYGDSHAGALHDRANKRGLPIWVGQEVCNAAAPLVESFANLAAIEKGAKLRRDFDRVTQKKQKPATEAAAPPKQIPAAKKIPPEEMAADLKEFTEVFCDSEPRQYSAFGDKRLLAGRPGSSKHKRVSPQARSRHRVALLALAVMSIEDVLVDRPIRPPLRMCFHPPTLATRAAQKQEATLAPRYWAPALAVGPKKEAWPEDGFCWEECQEGLIFGYQKAPDVVTRPLCERPTDEPPPERRPAETRLPTTLASATQSRSSRYDLRAGAHRINSLQFAVSYWGDRRHRFELGHDVAGSEKYFQRGESGILRNIGGRKAVVTLGYVLHYEENAEFRVMGAGVLLASGTQFKDFDIYAAIEPGVGHYRHLGEETTGYRWSARIGVGLSVFAVEGIVERGLEPSPLGQLEKEWRPSLNFRVRLAPSWLSLPFKKLKSKE